MVNQFTKSADSRERFSRMANGCFLGSKSAATDPKNGVVLRGNELEWRPWRPADCPQSADWNPSPNAGSGRKHERLASSCIELHNRVVAECYRSHLQLQNRAFNLANQRKINWRSPSAN